MKIVISGGGISGLSLASFLSRMLPKTSSTSNPNTKKRIEKNNNTSSITIVERSKDVAMRRAGGGIGLWPTSLSVLRSLPSVDSVLREKGFWMPSAGYYNQSGELLGRPTPSFEDRFPVLCLGREALLDVLMDSCRSCSDNLEIIEGVSVEDFEILEQQQQQQQQRQQQQPSQEEEEEQNHSCKVDLSNGETIYCDLLIAADGIHSNIRKKIHPFVQTEHMGYTYFRANVSVQDLSPDFDWHAKSFEIWGDSSHGPLRLGYVPLKKPEVFWFIAVPIGHNLSPCLTVEPVTEEERRLLCQLVEGWVSPFSPSSSFSSSSSSSSSSSGKRVADFVSLIHHSSEIIRTDINKIPNVSSFKWHKNGKVILMGDAAHATAPNLAQGAGLCIEDSSLLSHFLSQIGGDLSLLPLVAEGYEKERKPRASRVQFMADGVARGGSFWFPKLRDWGMKTAVNSLPSVEERIFEKLVSLSLGGNSQQYYCLPPLFSPQSNHSLSSSSSSSSDSFLSLSSAKERSFLRRVLSQTDFESLSPLIQEKKSSFFLRGRGNVNVKREREWLGRLFGLPPSMDNLPFLAQTKMKSSSSSSSSPYSSQLYTRVFDFGGEKETWYSTSHRVVIKKGEAKWCESVGVWPLDYFLSFMYRVSVEHNPENQEETKVSPSPSSSFPSLHFKSEGITFCGYKLPLPKFLLPSSYWTETPTKSGWNFNGLISLPLFGPLMRYSGTFEVDFNTPSSLSCSPPSNGHRVIIAGGTGMVGKSLCFALQEQGFEVIVLSRSLQKEFPFRTILWDGKNCSAFSHLIDGKTALVNLAGENPGSQKWTQSVKKKILQSRLESVGAMVNAIDSASESPYVYIQASAAGYYGSCGDQWLRDDEEEGVEQEVRSEQGGEGGDKKAGGTRFRMETCEEIESVVSQAKCKTISLRLGHVLSREGGLFPYLELASRCGVGKLGKGDQYVPWIHLNDASKGIVHLLQPQNEKEKNEIPSGPVNLVSPNPVTMKEMMSVLAKSGGRFWSFLPLSQRVLDPVLGESSSVLFDSERLSPNKLQRSGFHWEYPRLSSSTIQSL